MFRFRRPECTSPLFNNVCRQALSGPESDSSLLRRVGGREDLAPSPRRVGPEPGLLVLPVLRLPWPSPSELRGRLELPGLSELRGRSKPPGLSELRGRSELPGLSELRGRSEPPGLSELRGRSELPGLSELRGRSELPGLSELRGLSELLRWLSPLPPPSGSLSGRADRPGPAGGRLRT